MTNDTCGAAIIYTDENDNEQSRSTCEQPRGHKYSHVAGGVSWTRLKVSWNPLLPSEEQP